MKNKHKLKLEHIRCRLIRDLTKNKRSESLIFTALRLDYNELFDIVENSSSTGTPVYTIFTESKTIPF